MLFQKFQKHVNDALDALVADGALSADIDRSNVTVEPPRDPAHGDLATNAAMVLSKAAGKKPRELAEGITGKLTALDDVHSAEICRSGLHQSAGQPVCSRQGTAGNCRIG